MADPANLSFFMDAIRIQESGNNYQAVNPSGAAGAYQFIFGSWQAAMKLAGLAGSVFFGQTADKAPPSIQDAAAKAQIIAYYNQFGYSWFNTAEAWYGGAGAVGNPTIGGGPGYPDVGQYATDVVDIMNQLLAAGGNPAGPTPPGKVPGLYSFSDVSAALLQEQGQRSLGDTHSREQAQALVDAEQEGRYLGDLHSREQSVAEVAGEANARIEAINNTREQDAAAVAGEVNARIEAINNTREQDAARGAAETNARIEAINNTREQDAARGAAETNARIEAVNNTREQDAAARKALHDQLEADISKVLAYAQTIPGLIDNRAAAGYDPTLQSRASLLQKLLDTAVAHDPLVAGLVSNLVTAIVDLAGLENPLTRIAAQLVLKQVIDRLGINTALGAMINDLIGSILGGGPPKTLQTVVGDIGNRLDALESGQAALAPLAPEADQLREMGTLVFDASILGYLAAAVAAPVATADDTVAVFAPVTGPLLAPVRALLGM